MKCSLLVLSCHVDGELDPRRRGELEAHLVACERCRNGLAHLREEMDRIGALAPVHVPDHAARTLLRAVGILGEDDPLPPRPIPPAPASVDPPPWLSGTPGSALPWSPARPSEVGPAAGPRPIAPVRQEPPPGHLGRDVDEGTSAGEVDAAGSASVDGEPGRRRPVDADVEVNGTAVTPSVAGAGESRPVDPVPPDRDLAILSALAAMPPPPPGPAPGATTVDGTGAGAAAGAAAPGATDARPPSWLVAQPPTSAATSGATSPGSPVPAARVEAPATIARGRDSSVAAGPTSGHEETAGASDATPSPAARVVRSRTEGVATPGGAPVRPLSSTTAVPLTDSPAAEGGEPPGGPSSGDDAVPLRIPDVDTDLPPVFGEPPTSLSTDDAVASDARSPDAVAAGARSTDDGLAAGPPRAVRVGWWARLRDQVALRRALARPPADDVVDGVEIVSGVGAPVRLSRSRAELARRRSEALRPASLPDDTGPGLAARDALGRGVASTGRVAESWTAVDRATATGPAMRPPTPGRDDVPIPRGRAGTPVPGGVAADPAPPGPEAVAARGGEPRRTHEEAGHALTWAEENRRMVGYFVGAVVVLFVVGIVSARTTSPAPATPSVASSTAGSRPSSGTSPAASPAPSSQPATVPPSAVPSAPATSAPALAQVGGLQLTNPVTLGDGGSGWQLQGIRFGDHPGFVRMVFDLVPGPAQTGGAPRLTVGLSDPTTLVVVLAGTVSSVPQVQPHGLITAIAQIQPSPVAGAIVYQVKLAHAVTIRPALDSGPLRLVVDLVS